MAAPIAGKEPAGLMGGLVPEKRLNFAEDFLRRSAEYRDQLLDEMEDSWLGYMNHKDPRSDWKSNQRFALEYAQIETAKSSMFQALTAQSPHTVFEPEHADDDKNAEASTRVVDRLMNGYARFSKHLEDGLDSALIFGPCVWKIGWSTRRRLVPIFDKMRMGESEQRVLLGHQQVLLEGPSVSVVSPWDYLPDPQGADEEEQELIGHRVWLSPEKLMQRVRVGYDKDGIKRLIEHYSNSAGETTLTGSDPEEQARSIAGRSNRGQVDGSEHPTVRRIPIIELWSDDEVFTLGEIGEYDLIPLRYSRNYSSHASKPFVIAHYVRRAGDPFGLSMARFVRPVADSIASFHNQANDGRRLLIDPRYVVREGVILSATGLSGGPGSILRLPNPGTDIAPFPQAGRIDLAAMEEASLLQWADRVGAQSDFTRGVQSPGSGGTATEVAEISQRANARTALCVHRFSNAIERLWDKALSLTQQNMTREVAVRIKGRIGYEWRTYSPDNLAGMFVPKAKNVFNDQDRMQRPQRWLALAREWKDDPYIDPLEFRKRTFAALGEDDAHELVRDPMGRAEIPQVHENIALLQGIEMPVQPQDDHQAHILAMQAQMQAGVRPDGTPVEGMDDPAVRNVWDKHFREHVMMLSMMEQQAAAGPGAAGGGGGQTQMGQGGVRYDGSGDGKVPSRTLASRAPGSGQGRPPGPMGADRGGGF